MFAKCASLHMNVFTDASCQDAFLIDSTCYKIHKEPVRWFTAVNRCLSYNASLAVFDDDVRQYFPSSLLSDGRKAWIGLVKSWWTWPGLGQLQLETVVMLNVVVYKRLLPLEVMLLVRGLRQACSTTVRL